MKKLICILMLFAVLLSCCACGGDPAATTDDTGSSATSTEATEATEPTTSGLQALTPEQLYGHINQLEPVDGVYKIWSEVGVQNMADHPDGKFELLCNVDMGGAVVSPIGTADKPFTGEINGANFTISNFTLQGGDEADFGFVTVNKGTVEKLLLKDVTFIPGTNAQNIGALAGTNEGAISRCEVTGTLTVESAAENAACGAAAGISSGTVSNTITTVDIAFTAPAAATVGGIVGVVNGGSVEYSEANGKLDIIGTNKTAGLLAGSAKNAEVKNCAFVGASNTVDNVLFDAYFGVQENVTGSVWLRRDNSREPERPHVQEKRQKVVDNMNAMATVEWHLREDMVHSCTCQLSICHGTFKAGYTYYGPPYNHKASSLYRMEYCVDEDGYLEEFVEFAGAKDGYDMYIGSDCSSATLQALLTVGTEVWFTQTQNENPYFDYGTYAIGPYQVDVGQDKYTNGRDTKLITDFNGAEVMYDSYAQARMGDGVVYWNDGYGHSRICASDAVVVRDENGAIDPMYSYILMTEQGVETVDDVNKTYTSWRVEFKYTFANLYEGFYVPFTIKEFITGEFEEVQCTLEGGVSDSRLGLTTGTIVTNYSIDNVTMVITDGSGEEVYNHRLFTTVSKSGLDGSTHSRTRAPYKAFNLTNFATPLQQVTFQKGETYSAVITAHLTTGDEFVVNDFTFTNG